MAAGTNVKAEAVTNANAIVEFSADLLGNHASVNARTGDTTVEQKPIRKLEFMENQVHRRRSQFNFHRC